MAENISKAIGFGENNMKIIEKIINLLEPLNTTETFEYKGITYVVYQILTKNGNVSHFWNKDTKRFSYDKELKESYNLEKLRKLREQKLKNIINK